MFWFVNVKYGKAGNARSFFRGIKHSYKQITNVDSMKQIFANLLIYNDDGLDYVMLIN